MYPLSWAARATTVLDDLFLTNPANYSAWDRARDKPRMALVSDRMPTKAINGQKALALKHGKPRNIELPVWSSLSFLSDPYNDDVRRRLTRHLVSNSTGGRHLCRLTAPARSLTGTRTAIVLAWLHREARSQPRTWTDVAAALALAEFDVEVLLQNIGISRPLAGRGVRRARATIVLTGILAGSAASVLECVIRADKLFVKSTRDRGFRVAVNDVV